MMLGVMKTEVPVAKTVVRNGNRRQLRRPSELQTVAVQFGSFGCYSSVCQFEGPCFFMLLNHAAFSRCCSMVVDIHSA